MAENTNIVNNAFEAYYNGKLYDALALFYRILADDLYNSVNYYNVGLVYDSLEEVELAASYYKKSIRLSGSNVRSLNNLARIYIDKIKDYKVAEEYLNHAIEVAPQDAEAYNLFGNLSMLKHDFELAIKYFNKSIFLDKKYFKNYYDIAVAYYALNNTEDAKTNLNKSIELNPNFIPAQNLLQEIS